MEILKERELIDKYENLVLADVVLAKAELILLYYGSSWSDSSTDILPKLIEIYKTSQEREIHLVIIFISLDNDLESMKNYFKTHGDWYAVPYDDTLADELRWAYPVIHLPHIVVIAPDGKLISKNGCQEIMDYGKSVLVKWY